MKIGYILTDCDGYSYLIPEAHVDEFNTLCNVIDNIEMYSDDWYCYVEDFNFKYSDYRVEDISKLKVIIE